MSSRWPACRKSRWSTSSRCCHHCRKQEQITSNSDKAAGEERRQSSREQQHWKGASDTTHFLTLLLWHYLHVPARSCLLPTYCALRSSFCSPHSSPQVITARKNTISYQASRCSSWHIICSSHQSVSVSSLSLTPFQHGSFLLITTGLQPVLFCCGMNPAGHTQRWLCCSQLPLLQSAAVLQASPRPHLTVDSAQGGAGLPASGVTSLKAPPSSAVGTAMQRF